MDADRLLADEQPVADLPVRPALDDQRAAPRARAWTARTCPTGAAARRGRRRPGCRRLSPIGPASTCGERQAPGGAGSSSSASTSGGSWISARPASSRSSRSIGRAWSRSAMATASTSGSRASARTRRASIRRAVPARRPRRPSSPRPGASGPSPRCTAARSRCHCSARSAQRAGSSRPMSRAWNARAVASLASASRCVPGPPPASARATAASASARIRPARSRDAATSPMRRFSSASADDRSLDLHRGRGHARDRRPVLGPLEPPPAPLGGPARVDEVAAPHRERRGRLVGRDRELLVAARLELDEDAAQQPARLLARLGLDLDVTRLTSALTNGTPAGLQSIARRLSSRPPPSGRRRAACPPRSRRAGCRRPRRGPPRAPRAIPRYVSSMASDGRPSSSSTSAWLAIARIPSSIRPCARRPLERLAEESTGRLRVVALAARRPRAS